MRAEAAGRWAIGASRRAGYTFAEILATLAIASVLAAVAAPTYARFVAEQRLLGEARRLAEAITVARSEAIKRNGVVFLCAVAPPDGCGDATHWHDGWTAFQDLDGNGEQDGDDPPVPLAEPSGAPGVTIVGNAPVERYLRFTFSGSPRLVSGALQMGTFTVCRSGLRGYRVVLASTGRTRIERLAAACS